MVDVNKNAKSVDINKQDVNSMADNNQDTAGSELRKQIETLLVKNYLPEKKAGAKLWGEYIDVVLDIEALIAAHDTEKKQQVLAAIGEDEDLNAPPETYGRHDQSLGDNPHPDPNLQYVVRRAVRNVYRDELRQAVEEVYGGGENAKDN